MKKKNLIAASLAVILAVALAAGGTLAYLNGTSKTATNEVDNNFNWVKLTELEGNPQTDKESGNITNDAYEIIPGTSQAKDPTVNVSYSVDSYVYVTVKDTSGGLITWAVADGWTLLSSTTNSDGSVTDVYYRLVDGTEAGVEDQETDNGVTYYTNSFSVLKDDSISYSSSITNANVVKEFDDDGNPTFLNNDIKLTFQAYIIQAQLDGTTGEKYADPTTAYYVVKTGSSYYEENATYVAVEAGANTTLSQALASAISAASSEETTVIVLPEDSEISETYETKSTLINASSDIVLDLNGSEISVTDSSTSGSTNSIAVNGNGYDVTLANGKINFTRESSSSGSAYAALQTYKGDLTLDNMEVTYEGAGYCVSTRTDGGNVVVNDTTITSSTEGTYALYVGAKSTATVSGNSKIVGCIYLANCSSASSHTCLTITGGDFTEATFEFGTLGSVLVSGGTFAINLSENSHFKIADGYEVVTNSDGTYTVSIAD